MAHFVKEIVFFVLCIFASLDLQELVQNAEDAGARRFEIFYKEGDDKPASQLSYRSYFRVLKQSDRILIYCHSNVDNCFPNIHVPGNLILKKAIQFSK